MREEVCRIGRVIEDYLQFARLPKLQRQPVDLNAFLDQKLAFLCTELERANVKLRTHFDPALTTNQRRRRSIVAGHAEPHPQQPRSDARRRRTDHRHPARWRTGAFCASATTAKA